MRKICLTIEQLSYLTWENFADSGNKGRDLLLQIKSSEARRPEDSLLSELLHGNIVHATSQTEMPIYSYLILKLK